MLDALVPLGTQTGYLGVAVVERLTQAVEDVVDLPHAVAAHGLVEAQGRDVVRGQVAVGQGLEGCRGDRVVHEPAEASHDSGNRQAGHDHEQDDENDDHLDRVMPGGLAIRLTSGGAAGGPHG